MVETIILLNSGGFDSVVMAHTIREANPKANIVSLFFNYGQPNYEGEKACVKKCCDDIDSDLKEITLPAMTWTKSDFYKGSVDNQYLEYRNLVFLSYAVSVAEAYGSDRIFMATVWNGVDGYADCSTGFIKSFNRLIQSSGIVVETPFAYLSKEDLANLAYDYDIRLDDFYSCNNPDKDGKPCNKCGDCKIIQEMYNVLTI